MEEARAQPVCAQEALDLLNCVSQIPFDQEKCYRLLHSLRECVVNKEKYIGDELKEPKSVQEALQSRDWKQAMEAEIAALHRNGTWTLVPYSPLYNVVEPLACCNAPYSLTVRNHRKSRNFR